ncbi:hypothetical protein [Rurimicrobium arvi]
MRQPAGGNNRSYTISVQVQAGSEAEAAQMQEALQSFIAHFTVAEMKSAAHKLKSAANRKMIKTFL